MFHACFAESVFKFFPTFDKISMGNDTSVLSEYQVEEIYYAQLGPWTLHEAVKKNAEYEKVTIFTGKLKSYGQLSKEFQRAVEVETLILLKVSFMNICF